MCFFKESPVHSLINWNKFETFISSNAHYYIYYVFYGIVTTLVDLVLRQGGGGVHSYNSDEVII